MLQFNYSEDVNNLAIYLDPNYTGSYIELVLDFTQSYDQSKTAVEGIPVSTTNQYRNWLTFTVSGSNLPTASGQYDVRISEGTIDEGAIWNRQVTSWQTTNFTWDDATPVLIRRTFLYEDRAFVSGSNDSSITQYVSPNENGTYITYNG